MEIANRTTQARVSGQRGYFVSTIGRDEASIREYLRNQEDQ
jgi:REP element-mobilizing transposase RayT